MRGLLKPLIGAAIPLPYAVFILLPLCFSLLLSASIQPGLLHHANLSIAAGAYLDRIIPAPELD
jgi:hypothetical protein